MQSSVVHYFAYGSNLHPLRLKERIPFAHLIGAVKHSSQKLHFHKKGADGSGKCNLVKTDDRTANVYGALYSLRPQDKTTLDKIEGKGYGYSDHQIRLQLNNTRYTCFTYLAQHSHIIDNLPPYHWYKKLVILGTEYLEFPEAYINSIKDIESVQDPDLARRRLNANLVERIAKWSQHSL